MNCGHHGNHGLIELWSKMNEQRSEEWVSLLQFWVSLHQWVVFCEPRERTGMIGKYLQDFSVEAYSADAPFLIRDTWYLDQTKINWKLYLEFGSAKHHFQIRWKYFLWLDQLKHVFSLQQLPSGPSSALHPSCKDEPL